MTSMENFQATSQHSELTIAFLDEHVIAPSPINYAVIFLYITKNKPKLNELIEEQLQSDELISSDFIEDLYNRFVSYSHQIEKSILKPLENTLTKTLDSISHQVNRENKANASLEKLNQVLSSNVNQQSLENIVRFLFTTINNSQEQHTVLAEELTLTHKKIHTLKIKLEKSRQEALLDALTGLLNRRGCDEKLKALNQGEIHSSLAIDIDHFKDINDEFGHYIGDKVIQRIASTIQENITEQDIAVRYGGEEFIVVMVNKTLKEAKIIAEKIRLDISKMKLVKRNSNTTLPPVSVSIGIAENNMALDWSSLFQQADGALYQAKNSGRNCCVCS
ncbi:MAG: GGDEF domain-containing protein [Colwellia sp.]|nr:GGDEF domain-containing protein [Colwellia sp.]